MVVTPRTARFALAGAVVVATAALIYVAMLPFTEHVYRRKNGPWIHEPPRAHVFGDSIEMSPMEAVAWFVILGALAGGLLGVALARMRRREWTFMLGGAGLIGAVGFVYSVTLDEVCIGRGDVFACGYSAFFGWEIAPLAAGALWTAIGASTGATVGLLALRVTRRT